ncbi:PREDICTED: microsomal glutathione S-transferase 1 [Nanorana parkeri]|uniref:microsomal glutathione S-transferase 1 n=1 Tax=Nanorana parkeri TaxID=125878 RepID=UPI000854BF93|nr:PREDICTED: microsomal glutathione S-transferase 1 [Nanorana parkeri]
MSVLKQFADSEVFRAYATYVAVVLLKMMLMSILTSFFRITRKVYANPEDAASISKGGDLKKYVRTDETVERVRRCHLNDIENIVPFVGLGLVYALSNPDLSTALLHFRIFAGSRILHSISYLTPLPQPSRALTFLVGYIVNVSMAYATLRSIFYF